MNIDLHIHNCAGCSFSDALKTLDELLPHDATAIALLYAQTWCEFGRWSKGDPLRGSDGNPIELSTVYEARVWNTNFELRWLDDSSRARRTRGVLLTEQQITVPGWTAAKETIVGRLSQQYLLWGLETSAKDSLAPGWKRLTTARIGKLDVPIAEALHPQQKLRRVVLTYVEYLKEYDHGNIGVVEERLLTLTPLHPQQENDHGPR